MNRLNIVHFQQGKEKTTEVISLETLKTVWDDQNSFFWIDITHSDIKELQQFIDTLQIDCRWTDHFSNPEILTHMHDTPSAVSFYLYDIEHEESMADTSRDLQAFKHLPLLVIVSKRFTITYHQEHLDVIDFINATYDENFKLAGKTASFIVFLLFHQCAFNYGRLNLVNDNFIDALEMSESMPDIKTAGYNILTLKKMNANLHIILMMLSPKETHEISAEARVSFKEISQESTYIRDTIDSSRILLDSIVSSRQADSSYKTSEIMRFLTMISFIIMPLTLITGIYGMNFRVMPFIQDNFGFYLIMALLAFLVFGSLMGMRYLGWIGKRR